MPNHDGFQNKINKEMDKCNIICKLYKHFNGHLLLKIKKRSNRVFFSEKKSASKF